MIGIILLLIPFISGIHGVTWFQAQKYCSAMNGSLPGNTTFSEEPYWTRFNKKKSFYLKIIGCYMRSDVESNCKWKRRMARPSAGLCQEFCLSSNYRRFAIQKTKCVCLDNSSLTNLQLPSKCNFSCNEENDLKFATECGGMDAYNVFESDITMRSVDCISIYCGGGMKSYGTYECNQALGVYCQTKEGTNNVNWTESMRKCKMQNEYMFGKITLKNANWDCQMISPNRTNPSWLGVARQSYVSEDEGSEDEDNGTMQRPNECEVCENGGCSFLNCMNVNKVNIICCKYESRTEDGCFTITTTEVPEITTRIKTNTPPAYTDQTPDKTMQIPTEISPIYMQTTSKESLKNTFSSRSSSEQDIGIVVAVPLSVVICGGVVIAVLVVLYRRRLTGRTKTENETRATANNLKDEQNHHIASPDNNNYFVLQTVNHYDSGLTYTTNSESESPYNDLPEGEYDLLRDKDSRKKVLDDTYATSVKPSDYSDYDVTNRNRQTEEDSTYDHAGLNTISIYGYGSVQNQEQDENEYSKSEY